MKVEMATKIATLVHVDEDYIDMELTSSSSSSNFFTFSIDSPPPQNREFEFQMTKDSKTSPADDLFYKGKLLPLHLPPRLQMVQNLIENSNNATFDYVKSHTDLEDSRFPCFTTTESCRVSSSTEEANPFGAKKSLPKKLKQMKQFWIGEKLKSSRAYLKSLFSKSGCAANNAGLGGAEYMKVPIPTRKQNKNNNPFEIFYDETFPVMKTMKRETLEEDFTSNYHRKSFSGAIQRHCGSKASSLSTSSSGSSSSSSSFSAGYYDLQFFKRSISANYELEGSVEGAIAHCKQSHQSKVAPHDSQFPTKFVVSGGGNQERNSSSNILQ